MTAAAVRCPGVGPGHARGPGALSVLPWLPAPGTLGVWHMHQTMPPSRAYDAQAPGGRFRGLPAWAVAFGGGMRAVCSHAATPRYRERVLPNVTATRYVTPLREGGSLPAIVEADDLGTYVMKFHGAGQGRKALIAEIIAGELARRLGLRVPDIVTVDLDPVIGRHEPDPDVQDLLKASPGRNLGIDYLPGSLGFDPLAWTPDPGFAASVAVVRRADRQRRPQLAQPEPPRLARRRAG